MESSHLVTTDDIVSSLLCLKKVGSYLHHGIGLCQSINKIVPYDCTYDPAVWSEIMVGSPWTVDRIFDLVSKQSIPASHNSLQSCEIK